MEGRGRAKRTGALRAIPAATQGPGAESAPGPFCL